MKPAKVLFPIAVALLTTTVSSGAPAETAAARSLPPSAAFVEAYVYACQPVEYDFAGAREALDDAAREVHDGLFRVGYQGSCRDFYYGEVVPRLAPEMQPFFLPVGRQD